MMFSETVRLDVTRRSERELRLLGDLASRLWNAANYRLRQAFLAKEGVVTGARLEKLMKDEPEYRQLPSDVAQEVLKKLSESWKSYFRLRGAWAKDSGKNQKPGLPAYRKDRKTGLRPFDLIPIKHPRSYSLDPKDAHLVLPRDRRSAWSKGRLHIAYRGRRRFQGKMGRAEVYHDRVRRRWYLSWAVETKDSAPAVGVRTASVDLGVRISASLSIEGLDRALHFEGREALKDWDWLGREIAREQRAIAGTRGKVREDRAPSSRHISQLHRKRNQRLEHALRCLAKRIVETCREHGVAMVYLGWPKGILRDVSYGDSLWAGRIHGFWSFGRILVLLEAAVRKLGIASKRVGERGTSSTCPGCRSRSVIRRPRWLLRCKDCGERIHSDQAGSRNILSQQRPSIRWDGAQAAPRTETLRWTRHLWEARFANPGRCAAGAPEFLSAA